MFENLSDKLQNIIKKIKGETRINETTLNEMMREIKLALLEADVNYKVVKQFVADVSQKALGQDVLNSLTPGQQVVKIVNEELTKILGSANSKLNISPNPPTIIMIVGLQGSGKTTLCGKLSNYLRKNGKKPYMIACDVYRPAAIDQLETIGKSLDIGVYSQRDSQDVVKIAKEGIDVAKSKLCDAIIIDTAGRLQIDQKLMDELVRLKKAVRPHEIMLVIDSMTGQEAVNVAQTFNDTVGIDSIVMSKFDSDTRGGAALSVKTITNKPIKFASVGEKMSDLEPFYPDRVASRILGMGDVLSIIDKAQETYDEKQAIKLEKKIKKNEFDLDDYIEQFNKIKKMGSFKQILAMLPGVPKEIRDADIDEKKLDRTNAIVTSMTKQERQNPKILDASRRKRIAKGSGNTVEDVNRFINGFTQMQKMMKQLTNQKGGMPRINKFKNMKF